MFESLSAKNYIRFCVFIIMIAVFQIAFLSQALRANILISMFYILLLMRQQGKFLFKLLYFLVLVSLSILIFNNLSYFGYFIQKFQSIGTNGKVAEFVAVFTFISSDPILAVIGTGHGGEFLVQLMGQKVNFTHSLFSYLVLKNGLLLGLGINSCYWVRNSIVYIFDRTKITLLLYPLTLGACVIDTANL